MDDVSAMRARLGGGGPVRRFVIEHNFRSCVADPSARLDVPERFAPVVATAAVAG